jgi:AcrR family transcriptional regulator
MRTTVEHGNGTARASAPERRHRNARGEGARLADEIVAGAQALIERAGTDEAVTLRAVAREVGIAAPSIYAHFADREAIVLAVVARVFEELRVAVEAGITGAPDDPRERLVAGCLAYVEFGLANPARYRILFSPERADDMCAEDHLDVDHSGRPILELGGESFDLLLDAVEACARIERTGQIDVVADATAVWATLHGLVSLETALPGFPWPDAEAFVRRSVLRVIGVEAGAGR